MRLDDRMTCPDCNGSGERIDGGTPGPCSHRRALSSPSSPGPGDPTKEADERAVVAQGAVYETCDGMDEVGDPRCGAPAAYRLFGTGCRHFANPTWSNVMCERHAALARIPGHPFNVCDQCGAAINVTRLHSLLPMRGVLYA